MNQSRKTINQEGVGQDSTDTLTIRSLQHKSGTDTESVKQEESNT